MDMYIVLKLRLKNKLCDSNVQLINTMAAGRKIVAGSSIGGMKETQEMIDFAAKHNVKPDIELISMDYVNTAMERLLKADVKYRFVIDIGNTLKPTS